MNKRVIRIPAAVDGHYDYILEGSGAEISGYGIRYEYLDESKYHNNGNYSKITLIGEFQIEYNDEDIMLEELIANRIVNGKKVLNYQIYVYDNEGPVPHFHLKDNSGKVDCCICIYEPRYFDHGSHVDTLNNKELKVLNEFLKTKYSIDFNETYWNHIDRAWVYYNINGNPQAELYRRMRTTDKQPDYTHMVGFKSGK